MTTTADSTKTVLGKWINRPLKNLVPEIVPFWEGLRAHEFRLCRCKRCGACYFPYTVCTHHADTPDFDEMEWAPTSGLGRIFAPLVVHKIIDPDYADEVPFVLALLEMDEGPLFPTRVIDCAPGDAKVGLRVGIRYMDVPEAGHTLPLFAPTGD
jgi:uncharacterized protein